MSELEDTEDDPKHVPGYIVEQIDGLFTAWRFTEKHIRSGSVDPDQKR